MACKFDQELTIIVLLQDAQKRILKQEKLSLISRISETTHYRIWTSREIIVQKKQAKCFTQGSTIAYKRSMSLAIALVPPSNRLRSTPPMFRQQTGKMKLVQLPETKTQAPRIRVEEVAAQIDSNRCVSSKEETDTRMLLVRLVRTLSPCNRQLNYPEPASNRFSALIDHALSKLIENSNALPLST